MPSRTAIPGDHGHTVPPKIGRHHSASILSDRVRISSVQVFYCLCGINSALRVDHNISCQRKIKNTQETLKTTICPSGQRRHRCFPHIIFRSTTKFYSLIEIISHLPTSLNRSGTISIRVPGSPGRMGPSKRQMNAGPLLRHSPRRPPFPPSTPLSPFTQLR